jgi:ATP-dependent exoDNAse (exonuclease V) beta subunit
VTLLLEGELEIMPKVITASAGTGKTYRLSLEFVNTLLSNRECKFDEILVITFTKKATAEIREKIFSHLRELTETESEEIWKSLRQINPKLQISNDDLEYLREVYHSILTNKARLKVSTIDSFINNIFKSVIAPYYNIANYSIDPKVNKEYYPYLYEILLNSERAKQILSEKGSRNIEDYDNFLSSLINRRWQFDFAVEQPISDTDSEAIYREYRRVVRDLIQLFEQECLAQAKDMIECIRKKTITELPTSIQPGNDFKNSLQNALGANEPKILLESYAIILDHLQFWDKNKLFKKKNTSDAQLQEKCAHAKKLLADYLMIEKFLPEEQTIRKVASQILARYDELKLRDRIFTYDDIVYYTWCYLYDPEISLIEERNVLNLFYEMLSYRIRYVLIDEFQDTSILQWNILSPLINEVISGSGQKEYGSAVIVGDEKQAIYGWRSGERDLLLNIDQFTSIPWDSDTLKTSYRSKKNLIQTFNRIFSSNELTDFLAQQEIDWRCEPVETIFEEDGFLKLQISNTEAVEFDSKYEDFVKTQLLPALHKNEINPKDTAIIARKNKQLEEIAKVLNEQGIDFVMESSSSLLMHKAIKPIRYLLEFLAYRDAWFLFRFLRSDLALLDADSCSAIIKHYRQHKENIASLFLYDHPLISALEEIYEISRNDDIVRLIKIVLEKLSVCELFATESDLKNIYSFLELTGEFDRYSHRDYGKDIVGFVRYLDAIEHKEEYTQQSLDNPEAISLLTIHKSKGLQFETLFLFVDLSERTRINMNKLQCYGIYNESYNGFRLSRFTYNYAKVLKKSSLAEVINIQERKDLEEQLNTYYVAFTRAKNNLIIYASYKNKKNIEAFLDHETSKPNIAKLLIKAFYYILKKSEDIDEYSCSLIDGYPVIEKESEKKRVTIQPEQNYFSLQKEYEKKDHPEIPIKRLQKQALLGEVAHHYLSYLIYDTPKYREMAKRNMLKKYGTILGPGTLSKIEKACIEAMESNPSYFSPQNWSFVYTEIEIYDKDKEYRIDRLMLNQNTAMIIDYKSGELFELSQLDRYSDIISKIPLISDKNLQVDSKIITIDI